MNPDRKHWNEQQQALRQALGRPEIFLHAIALFLDQHAMVHSAKMSASNSWSFEDEVWQGLSETQVRCIPAKMEHSIVWLLWHMARIEDVTMNLLLAGSPQLFHQGQWAERLCVPNADTGNGWDVNAISTFSATIDVEALRDYRLAVGRSTRYQVQKLNPLDLKHKVDPTRLAQVTAQGTVLDAGRGVIDYWAGLTLAGLLLMPPTRHNFLHLNEALRIKSVCQRP